MSNHPSEMHNTGYPNMGESFSGMGTLNVSGNNAGGSPPKGHDSDGGDNSDEGNDKRSGRRKIKIEYIPDKSRRHITFSKRKAGIMKKAYELSTLTGTQVLLLVVSETGLVYTFTTPKLQPLVTKPEGKNLIQACLNSPDPVNEEAQAENEPEPEPSSVPAHPSHPESSYYEDEKQQIPAANPTPKSHIPSNPPSSAPSMNYPPNPSNPYGQYHGVPNNMPNYSNFPNSVPQGYPQNPHNPQHQHNPHNPSNQQYSNPPPYWNGSSAQPPAHDLKASQPNQSYHK